MNQLPFSQFELFYGQKKRLPLKKFPVRKVVFFLLVLLLLGLTTFGLLQLKWAPSRGGVLVEGLVGQPRLINPLFADLNPVDQLLSSLVFRGLVKFDSKNLAVGDLAEKWDLSADAKIYTVTLKKDQKWEDGKVIGSDDVVFTYKLTQNQAYNGPEKLTFRNVLIEKIDNWQIRFTLAEPFSPFLESLTLGILPKSRFAGQNASQALKSPFNLKPQGSGRFKVESVENANGQIKSIILKSKAGYIEKLKIIFYGSAADALTALKLGEIDSLATINPNDLAIMGNFKNIESHPTIINNSQYAVFFNLAKTGLTQNPDFRRALALATPILSLDFARDNPELVEGLTDFGLAASGPYPQKSWAFDEQEQQVGFDLAKAKDKILSLNLLAATQIVLTVPLNDSLLRVATLLKNSWEKTGIKVLIKEATSKGIAEKIIPNHDFEILLFGQEFGADPDLYIFWHSTQNKPPGLNLSSFANRRADKALEEGRKNLDQGIRIQSYKNLQIAINQDIPAIFLYQPKLFYLISKKIKNVSLSDIWSSDDRFNDFEEWYIKQALRLK